MAYDLNAIADALAAKFQGLATDTYDGVPWTVTASSVIGGTPNVPAVLVELDDIAYDMTMSRGADGITFLAYLIVSAADSPDGQRLVRQMLSSGGAADRCKDALNGLDANGNPKDRTLGGLVSYAQMSGTRTIGSINYAGVAYLGATLEIQVVVQP